MRSRIVVMLALAAMSLARTTPAVAQETHQDPATSGTTGLFTVPTSSVLGPKEFHAAAYFYGWQVEPGDSSVEYGGLSFAVAFAGAPGLEIFGTFEPRIGVHRNYTVERAQGFSDPAAAAPRLDDHPFATDRWRTGIGDLYFGAKYKVLGEPEAFDGVAVLARAKLPTSDTDAGIGTGEFDFSAGVTASREAAEMVGVTGYAGGTFRSSPDEIEVGNKFDYGIGVQVPTRFWISAVGELIGSFVSDPGQTPNALGGGVVTGYDPIMLMGGIRLSHESGFAADLGWMYNLNVDAPDDVSVDELRDNAGFIKVSYTNSRREPVVYVGAAPMDLPPVNGPPTLSCRAERTSVRVGESVRLFADVNDPDGDDVTVTWATQAGTINPREGEEVTWSSEGVDPGSGPVTARASDGYGGTADCQLTLTVTEPPPPPEPEILTFNCAEFPSGNTRIDNRCKAILDDVALQMRQNPSATAVITGHSDSAGDEEDNVRLSQERADNAETYLVDTHGIDGNRIETASAGSSEPVADNETAEGRLQNRRIVVVVTIPAQ